MRQQILEFVARVIGGSEDTAINLALKLLRKQEQALLFSLDKITDAQLFIERAAIEAEGKKQEAIDAIAKNKSRQEKLKSLQ